MMPIILHYCPSFIQKYMKYIFKYRSNTYILEVLKLHCLFSAKSSNGFSEMLKVFSQFLTLYNYNNIVHLSSLSSFPSRTVVLGYCYTCFHQFPLIGNASPNLNCHMIQTLFVEVLFCPATKNMVSNVLSHPPTCMLSEKLHVSISDVLNM